MHSQDDHLVYHIEKDWKGANLDPEDRAILNFVQKLNFTPGKIAQEDVDTLMEAGFDDRAVLDIIMVTAMFNFMNRLADGVGIRAADKFRRVKERKDSEVEGNTAEVGRQKEGAAD